MLCRLDHLLVHHSGLLESSALDLWVFAPALFAIFLMNYRLGRPLVAGQTRTDYCFDR